MLNIRPLEDRVLVRPMEPEKKTTGGIILPDTAAEKNYQGQVIAIGPGKADKAGKRLKPEVKPGDKVIYAKYGGTSIKFDGEEYVLLREDDVLALIS